MCEKCNKKIPDLNEEKRAQEKIDKYYLYFFKYHLLALIVIPLLFGAVFFYINMYVACIMIALLFTIKKIFFVDFFNKFDMIEKIKTKIKTKIEIQ